AEWDEPLYALCRRRPDHARLSSVIAKVGLIGRSYATGLERHVRPRKNDSRVLIVAEHLCSERKTIDGLLRELRAARVAANDVNEAALAVVLRAHGELVRVLQTKMHRIHKRRFVTWTRTWCRFTR